MKIIYTINSTFNSGGMERILMQKANYFADVKHYEVVIVTTEQGGKDHFFRFSDNIQHIDLGINYNKVSNRAFRFFLKPFKRQLHKRRLKALLFQEKADICISMFDYDSDFLYSIKDGSKKILEFHFNKMQKVLEERNPVFRLFQRLRVHSFSKTVKRYDRFVVLTQEDREQWGRMDNIEVIPNFISIDESSCSRCENKRVISVGRFCYQKGFERLIEAWRLVEQQYSSWELCLFGNGDRTQIDGLTKQYGLKNVRLHSATPHIVQEYLNSSLYVLSSRYEGLPMVLLEAMSLGLPIVAFACPCGPKDIIRPEFGTLVSNGDITALANSMMDWIRNERRRKEGGIAAHIASLDYSSDFIMKRWIDMFDELLK